MIHLGVCVPSAKMNSRNLLGMHYINHLLNFLSWSVYLNLLLTINFLILHTVLPGVLLFPPDPFFLSIFRNPPHFEHLYVVVSKLGHNDPLDLDEVKLYRRFLLHLTVIALQRSGSFSNFRGEWNFFILMAFPTVTCSYLRD